MRKKEILAVAMLVLAFVFALSACSDAKGSVEYVLSEDGTYYIARCISTDVESVTISSSYRGKPVTSIDNRAFCGCLKLTSIDIPDSVTHIGDSAFKNCIGLMSLTISARVTDIGVMAFKDCSGLTSIVVENGNSVYHSNGNCLIETESKTLVAGCSTSVIPTDGSVTTIGDYAFHGCSNLTSITIPESVTGIGNMGFSFCPSLTSVVVENGNSVYHSNGNCLIETESKTLVAGCSTSVIPTDGSVTTIGDYAFFGCTNLTSITIPESVTDIGFSAFALCGGDIFFSGTKDEWNAIYEEDENSVVIDLETGEAIFCTIHCTDGNIFK